MLSAIVACGVLLLLLLLVMIVIHRQEAAERGLLMFILARVMLAISDFERNHDWGRTLFETSHTNLEKRVKEVPLWPPPLV